ncbi:site-specific integrase [Burkholderiaceae bacterium DAT-1]|nr:site-specific integrase [Burkholderiaceae bacterium DAT-1]
MPDFSLLRPLERLDTLPEYLSGCHGSNRFTGQCQIAANNDLAAIHTWLNEFPAQSPTWRAYRKAAERIFLWSLCAKGKPLSSLNRDDLDEYEAFLISPPASWCAPRATRRETSEWRPFEGALSANSRRLTLIAANALFSWLVEARYLVGNPLALRKSRLEAHPASNARADRREVQQLLESRQYVTRFFPRETFECLLTFIDRLPNRTTRERHRKARAAFAVPFLQQTGLRLTEFCMAQMGDIRKDKHGWWIHVLGKGNQLDQVPLPDAAVEQLKQYRIHNRLSPLPKPNEATPLLLQARTYQPLEPGSFYRWLRDLFVEAARYAQANHQEEHAIILEKASTHWLRHTAFSHQADEGIDLRVIQANARHKSLNTTSLYLHAGDAEQHWQTTAKHVLSKKES